jgi:hypothetical protein
MFPWVINPVFYNYFIFWQKKKKKKKKKVNEQITIPKSECARKHHFVNEILF